MLEEQRLWNARLVGCRKVGERGFVMALLKFIVIFALGLAWKPYVVRHCCFMPLNLCEICLLVFCIIDSCFLFTRLRKSLRETVFFIGLVFSFSCFSERGCRRGCRGCFWVVLFADSVFVDSSSAFDPLDVVVYWFLCLG
jgi:hypothetical protein